MKKFDLIDYNDIVADFTQYDFTPKELVVMKCHECCAYEAAEVKKCTAKSCPLYPLKLKWYRIPHTKKTITPERLEQLKQQTELMRQKRLNKYEP